MSANTEYVSIDLVEKQTWDNIVNGGGGSSLPAVTTDDNGKLLGVTGGAWGKVDAQTENVFVPFTVTADQQGANVTTTADFADVKAAVEAGKNVIAKVTYDGMIVCGGLSGIYPDINPTVLGFCVVVDISNPGEQPAPQLFKISWGAEGAVATITNLTVAT